VEIKDKWVDDEIERMQRWGGKQEAVEGPVQEGDVMDVKGRESGKPHGLKTEFKLYFNALTADAKKQFDGRKKGDVLAGDIFNMEEGVDEDYVRKYFLDLEEGDDREVGRNFEITITGITRTTPAEVTTELINNYLGEGKASDLEEVRAYFKKDIQKAYDQQADNLFFGHMLDYLFEKNAVELPEAFIKKWLKHNSDKLTDQDIEKNYKDYEDSLKRRILLKKITEKFGLRISEEEVIDRIKMSLRNNYFGPQADDALLSAMVKNMQSDNKYNDIFDRNADEILSDKMKDVMKEAVTLKPVSINEEQFRELVKKTNKKYEAIDKIEEKLDLNTVEVEED
jgi:trigger factor